jgi:hypothetical protein
MTMKLFQVTTQVKEYCGCKDVTFYWFKSEAKAGERPYRKLIADYSPGKGYIGYAEGAIDELFTEGEAKQLAAYLDGNEPEDLTTITEVSLPIGNDRMGHGAIPVGGGQDFLMITERPDYPLPFAVWGYFDLRGCELIDGRGTYGGWFLEFDAKNGTLRRVDKISPDPDWLGVRKA